MKSGSALEKVLETGKFAVTAELGPPQNANPEVIKKNLNTALEMLMAPTSPTTKPR